MCGIAGSINYQLPFQKVKQAMLHRGPDAQEGFRDEHVHFYHLRLSILDIAGGAQPMRLRDRYTIIFNGQIYNHQELRKQYRLEGTTYSDTETLLLLYEKFGTNMLDLLDGMFAFAIHDNVTKEVFLARDRAGKKPLYIYENGSEMVFASELNCLRSILPLEMNAGVFPHYFRLGVFYRKFTPYRFVRELTPGTWVRYQTNTLQKEEVRWWNVHKYYADKHSEPFEEALAKTENMLRQSVQRRLTSSDLEVGCFLSGGIDSGLTTALASEINQNLQTFTVSFPGAYNEAPLAKLVAEKYHTKHTEINLSFDHLQHDIEKILLNYGEPFFDSSAIPSFYVSREARKHLTVILNGDGADELFGGYRRYVPFSQFDFFQKSRLVTGLVRSVVHLLPHPQNKKSKYNFLYRLIEMAGKSGLEIYFSAGLDILEGYEKHLLDTGSEDMEEIRNDFAGIVHTPLSGLKKVMNLDFDNNLCSDLLVKMDIAAMANSLEGRSPFLSKELLEYIPGLPDIYKIKGATTKVMLRRLAQKYLPETLVNQPKRGFEVPLKDWVNGPLKFVIRDYLMSSNALHPAFLNKGFTTQLLEQRVRIPAEKRAKILWTLFCLEVWYKKNYLA